MKLDNHTLFETAVIPLPGIRGLQLTVIVKGTFGFDGLPCFDQIPIAFGDLPYNAWLGGGIRYETDIVPFKPMADIVLEGHAWAPEEKPAQAVLVTLRVGDLSRSLCVFGDRCWDHSSFFSRIYVMTAAKPFINRPIIYRDAFGGVDAETGAYCRENPCGTGYFSLKSEQQIAGRPLPAIEDPRCLVKTRKDYPKPAGFGFTGRGWQPRAALAGTYDDEWREYRKPLPPADFDPRFYNGAHPDLQVEGYLKGDERVELTNLNIHGKEQFDLPAVRTHCWVERRTKPSWELEETIDMHLDTLFLMPDQRRYCLVWRGSAALTEPSTAEIERVTLGASKIKNEGYDC